MIRFIIAIAFSFIYFAAFSQEVTEDTDSSSYYKQRTKYYIKQERKLKYSDPQKKVLYDSIAYYYKKSPDDTLLYYYNLANLNWQNQVYNNYDSLFSLIKENLDLSIQMDFSEGVYISSNILISLYNHYDQHDSSLIYSSLYHNYLMKQTRNINEISDKLYLKIGRNLQYVASSYVKLNSYDLGLFLYFRANDVFSKISNLDRQEAINLTIGHVYTTIGDNKNSLIRYAKALEINKIRSKGDSLFNDPPVRVYTNMGSVYINLHQYDTALYYTNLAISLRIKYSLDGKKMMARLYNNKGICHRHINQNDSAMIYFEKSMDLFNQLNSGSNIVKVKVNIATAYIEWGDYYKAEKILLEQIDLAKKVNYQMTLVEIYRGLSVIYENTNRYKKSLEYNKTAHFIKDSVQSLDVRNKLNEYKEKYETELKEQDIVRLTQESVLQKSEQEKTNAQKENQQLISLILIILVVSLIVILFFLRRNSKLTRVSDQEKFTRKEKEKNQRILDLVKNQEMNSINSFILGQDKERNRIAAELHDRLGSLLSTVKLHFSSFETEIEEGESKKSFNFAIDLLDNSVSEVRSISHNLSKGMITEFGLSKEIENLRDAINSAGVIRLKYIIIGENISINPDRSIEIFRIIQEVVTNAIKHSQSEEIFIQQINSENDISISIEDYGVGFNMDKIKNNGMGLANLQNRANKIGASCIIESVENQGTTVTIEIEKK